MNRKGLGRIIALLISVAMISSGLSGCDGERPGLPPPGEEEETPKEAYEDFHSDYVLPVTPYTEEDKTYAPSLGAGHWERTDVIRLDKCDEKRQDGDLNITAKPYEGGEFKNFEIDYEGPEGPEAQWDIFCDSVSDRYGCNGYINPCVTFKLHDFVKKPKGEIFGSMYFADIEKGDDAFGQKITIRDYFYKKQGSGRKPLIMSHFSGTNEGLGGSADDKEGVRHHYFYPSATFPKMADFGDKINVVLDVYDMKDAPPRIRYIWEYTYKEDGEKERKEAEEAEKQQEELRKMDPDWWDKREYSGRWDVTDVKYLFPKYNDVEEDHVKVHAERYGVDGEKKIVTFTNTETNETVRYEIPEIQEKVQYPGDLFYQEIIISCDSDAEEPPGYVVCALELCDVDYVNGKYGTKLISKQYFQRFSKDVVTFGPIPHDDTMYWREDLKGGLITLDGSFPEGKKDGEKTNLVLAVMDSTTGSCRMFDIYEYTWREGPITEWDYNPPMPD